MQQAGYQHANLLAMQMRVDFNNQQAEVLAMMQDFVVQEQPPAQDMLPEQPPTQQVANAAIADTVQLQILQILQTMQATQQQGQRHDSQNNDGNQQRTGGGNQNGGTQN